VFTCTNNQCKCGAASCTAELPFCKSLTSCVACLADRDCSNEQRCDPATNTCKECVSNSHCLGDTNTCISGVCTCGATADNICADPTPYCNTAGECVACRNDAHCPGQYCDLTTSTCVPCTANSHCTYSTNTCTSNACKCGANEACSGATPKCKNGTCVACSVATDCFGTTPVCD
jgi:Cys-rich repeat protein